MRTLKDRLSHLSFAQACKLLGPQGKALILEGGKFDIDLQDQVALNEDHFRLTLGKVRVDISLNSAKRKRIDLRCSARIWINSGKISNRSCCAVPAKRSSKNCPRAQPK